jgi:protein arginine kinase activator
MGKSLKCDVCNASATVHLTQIINNQIHKIDLCESCAEEKGITNPDGYSLADLLVKPGVGSEEATEFLESSDECPECEYTQKEFKKTGRLGCEHCYETFAPLLGRALQGMHRGDQHKGKVPEDALERKSYEDRISSLEGDLQKAIANEQYEEAAQYRDEILELKKSLEAEETA